MQCSEVLLRTQKSHFNTKDNTHSLRKRSLQTIQCFQYIQMFQPEEADYYILYIVYIVCIYYIHSIYSILYSVEYTVQYIYSILQSIYRVYIVILYIEYIYYKVYIDIYYICITIKLYIHYISVEPNSHLEIYLQRESGKCGYFLTFQPLHYRKAHWRAE